jgi:hypothetical protein
MKKHKIFGIESPPGSAQAERWNFVKGKSPDEVMIFHWKRHIATDGSDLWLRDYDSLLDGTTTQLETAREIWKDRVEEGWVRRL